MGKINGALEILLILFCMGYLVNAQEVYVIEVSGIIDSINSGYVQRGLTTAEDEGAQALVIQIDTPGGMDTSMRAIIQDILDSPVPVVVYVNPRGARAASAGAFILVSSHVGAMTPGTNVGAAHPVGISLGGEASPVTDKVTNDAAAYMRSLAELKGRNISAAEGFVINSTSITASEAKELGIIEIIADDYDDLLGQLHGMEIETSAGNTTLDTESADIKRLEITPRESFLHIISDPNVAYILFLAGMYGIIFELSNPGTILPGVVGGIAMLMALWSFQALSISTAGLALIIFAVLLFIAETQLLSHGILTIGGLISLVLGSLLLLDSEKEPFVQISLGVILSAAFITAIFVFFAIGLAIKTLRSKPSTGKEGMIGLIGKTRSELSPEGNVFVHGEIWQARAKMGEIEKDRKVKVVDMEDLVLIVEEIL